MAQYGKKSYWDERYTKDPEPFDWYQRYAGIKHIIEDRVKESDNILMVGAGNSSLTEDMYEDGYTNITNIDISPVVVKQMQERVADLQGVSYVVMDCTTLDFGSAYFDVAIDKGCSDSLLCGEGSTANYAKYLTDVSRVLKPNGTFIVVSYGVPDHRLNHIDKPEYGWTVDVATVPKPSIGNMADDEADSANVHYVYTMKKGRQNKKK
eukprot:TRINITY_DN23861_c0_g1_i1.p2 TRINITY_DN23861_c0_g1~~TRINITY_DN23861_c0_g1_i1.p2  ORF type:complete len:208 (-),score=59.36 TRINITY_DN23861_c0_g1_i1:121-744(-)